MAYKDFLIKVSRRIDNMAEARGMTRKEFEEWSLRETHRREITNDEHLLIKAYMIDQAILRIEATTGGEKLSTELTRQFYWINNFRDSFEDIDKAIKHLTDVCAYIRKNYDEDYKDEWLLTFDDDFYFGAKEKKGSSKLKWK